MNRNDKMKKHNKYALLALKAMERAAAKVAEDARRNNYKIPIWRDGRIAYEIPEMTDEQADSAINGHRTKRSTGHQGASAPLQPPDAG